MQPDFFLSIPKKDRILLMQFSRILPMERFKKYANERTALTQYLDDFPEFHSVFVMLDDMQLYYHYYPHARETKTEAITTWESELKKLQKQIQPKAQKLVKLFQQLKKQGKITEEKANPHTKGNHFLKAREMSQQLASLWFIGKVSLFGSVASGLEKESSDIDLILHHTIRAKKKLKPVWDKVRTEMERRYNVQIRMWNHSKHLERIAFYEPTISMAEKPTINIFGQQTILKKDLKDFVVDVYSTHTLQFILLPRRTNDTGYSAVLISDTEQIALFSIKTEGKFGISRVLAANGLALKKQNIPLKEDAFQRFTGEIFTELMKKHVSALVHVFPESFYESHKDMPSF
ncbi:nucleotidyltransferase domain-containing protein [Fictibacillus sp. B-59209]|uniref:nucleotidyltransferase domain-containing protein n=1 Tax=Fictibacillus sp. B-59209 TaxID=3024873 RepID=UPI002E207DE7|nr:nucleotidyltransferase domain-containing protein [Fictibacillus sp. B-59209]